jgi:hypothetical protein
MSRSALDEHWEGLLERFDTADDEPPDGPGSSFQPLRRAEVVIYAVVVSAMVVAAIGALLNAFGVLDLSQLFG